MTEPVSEERRFLIAHQEGDHDQELRGHAVASAA